MKNWRVPSLLACLALMPSLAAAQGLGDAAAKEKKRRDAVASKGERKVVTEDDLKNGKGTIANEPAAVPAAAAGSRKEPAGELPRPPAVTSDAQPASDPEPTHSGGDENEWRQRAADARRRIRVAEENFKIYDDYMKAVYPPGLSDPMPTPDRVASTQKRSEALAELTAARQALDELETEARRARVPPGWLRE